MRKLNFDKVYFLYFNVFLFLAGIISIYEKYLLIFGFVILTFFVFYYPYLFNLTNKFVKMSPFEYFLVLFVYGLIFLRAFDFGSYLDYLYLDFIFRVLKNLFVSFLICILGFFVFYYLLKDKDNLSKFNLGIIILFMFSFSIMFVCLFSVIWYLLNYIFSINLFYLNLSAVLGFISVHLFGSFLVSLFVGLYLYGDDKHKIVFYLKKLLGIKNFKSNLSYEDILKLIALGESDFVEFKETLRTNIHTGNLDKRMEHSVLKTIVAFLNSKSGGILFVGVSDLGELKGLSVDNFKNEDKCKLQLINMIKQHIGSEVCANIKVDSYFFDDLNGDFILKIEVNSFRKEVFLHWEKKDEFYVRAGPASINLSGREMLEYIRNRFRH